MNKRLSICFTSFESLSCASLYYTTSYIKLGMKFLNHIPVFCTPLTGTYIRQDGIHGVATWIKQMIINDCSWDQVSYTSLLQVTAHITLP